MKGMQSSKRKRILKQLIERDGTKCHYCGCELVFEYSGWVANGYSLDHVIARDNGGTDELNNFVLACRECNGHKSTGDYATFRFERDVTAMMMYLLNGDDNG